MIKSIIYLILGLFVLVGGFLELKRELSANKSKDKKKKKFRRRSQR
ncbi:hypothetical protein QS257_05055 [Terrilactibacillus sp. S3-3]|nr:hypothetical protein QS257_05055 [Terrilactibacillus sp. S3-3]